jgi:hypothetical protein
MMRGKGKGHGWWEGEMKTELERQDIQAIAEKVVELLRPYMMGNANRGGKSNPLCKTEATVEVAPDNFPDFPAEVIRIAVRHYHRRVQVSCRILGHKKLALRAKTLQEILPHLREVVKKLVDGEPGIDEGR